MNNVELLAPAGNTESLLTAIESGCDAVYFGLESFNARSRAKNFKIEDLPDILKYCHKRAVKVYITMNTLIKNNEITNLIKLVFKLVACKPDAIIIQDFGLYFLLKELNYDHIHLSTQAGIHNSLGVKFANVNGIERSILARELTLAEIKAASREGDTEVFVHGALCYSLSGYCLFSSFLGGMSANRGKCKQPCRRTFKITKRKEKSLYSLKDLQLIDYLPELIESGVKSLKIEGRMKRSEYVNKVVSAYRMALDDFKNLPQAQEELANDFGRSKTSYFAGGNVTSAITDHPFAGIFLGYAKIRKKELIFKEMPECQIGDKIKLYYGEEDSDTYTIEGIDSSAKISISSDLPNHEKVAVYKVSSQTYPQHSLHFESRTLPNISRNKIQGLTQINSNQTSRARKQLFIRISKLNDIKFIPKTKYEHNYLVPLEEFNTSCHNKNIFWELPLFIPESEISKVRGLIEEISKAQQNHFSLSHISQTLLLPPKSRILANENIYTLNNLAIKQLKKWGISEYILPFENDIPNLNHYSYQDGIIPLFFTPPLFSSRMPVKAKAIKDRNNSYQIIRKNRLSLTYPSQAVCVFSFFHKFKNYHKFFIDISTPNIQKDDIKRIFSHLEQGVNLPDTSKFNYKKGLW